MIMNAEINAFLLLQSYKFDSTVKDFIEILCTKCLLLDFFVTVDLAMLPKITALLHHSACHHIGGKVIKMLRLNEPVPY